MKELSVFVHIIYILELHHGDPDIRLLPFVYVKYINIFQNNLNKI